MTSMTRSYYLYLLLTFFLLQGCVGHAASTSCSNFVMRVAPVKTAYMAEHQLFPVPAELQALANRYLPQLRVHPQSWQPISFASYLAEAKLIRHTDDAILSHAPTAASLAAMPMDQQCGTYLQASEIKAAAPAPVYVQVYRDRSPTDPTEQWTYIKYNPVFDWSGLATKTSAWAKIGSFLTGGHKDRWHRLDIHTAAILAFDSRQRFRLLTLAQHNHQQTFLVGRDLPADQPPQLVAARQSNELYLDQGESEPVEHRVVTFFNKADFLIDPQRKPWLWAIDVTQGRNAGAEDVALSPEFLPPDHPLADFAGYLGPPRRVLGLYVGRDGPPGYNYYAPPEYLPLPDFVTMGYWQAGDQDLLQEISPVLKGLDNTDWRKILDMLRQRLEKELAGIQD